MTKRHIPLTGKVVAVSIDDIAKYAAYRCEMLDGPLAIFKLFVVPTQLNARSKHEQIMKLGLRFFFFIFFLVQLAPATQAEPAPAGALMEFLRLSPLQLEVYRRKVAGVASETDGPAGQFLNSPTILAMEGLSAIAANRVADAEVNAARLDARAQQHDNLRLYPFEFDYTGPWPYSLKSPWISALSQGLALALNTQLFVATKKADYADRARAIAATFSLPIEQGGFARFDSDGVQFEEYPVSTPTRVLNGGAIATLALADFSRVFGDPQAAHLLQLARSWWEANIARYDVTSPDYPFPVSAYSLASKRNELLFHLRGDSPALVDSITWTFATGRSVSLDVGANGDDDRNHESYIWLNQTYQNWGTSRIVAGATVREIVPHLGRYDHAPFSVTAGRDDTVGPATIAVTFRGIPEAPLKLQLLVHGVYIDVASIPAERSDQDAKSVSTISSELLRAALESAPTHPPIEPGYFADNATLVRLLASEFGSSKLTYFAERWEMSASQTPAAFDARGTFDFLTGASEQPILATMPGEDGVHVEYPAVIESHGLLFMFYSAFGTDSRWRIKLATSGNDGRTWDRHGWLFREDELPFEGNYAFPSVIFDAVRHRYVMVFSAAAKRGKAYDSIFAAHSLDLWNWTLDKPIVREHGLRPVLWPSERGLNLIYSVQDGDTSFSLLEAISNDGISWTAGRSVYSVHGKVGERGFYTSARIMIGGKEFFVLDAKSAPQRLEWQLLCRAKDGRLVPATAKPLWLSGVTRGSWDEYRYGPTFLEANGTHLAFYNGIPLEPNGSGQIGMAQVNDHALASVKFDPWCN
ncbi:D-glucuronyl C5-epimerase family protein [Bradyrhizobium sp. 6(2017)]|uniref:D-glucuronyl C5-epimerase family protein n=1 Tax=Bradyrhizobium sp. 6(2017) TaxID=1197460 RepID=UPI0013E18216|nr:D-glucuronyl C5-epimerase family protein [Bradyrhizobium sp. 6(2017)]QIG91091.1 hypothetical protein G6P99_00180 [Bradyrhizobium sp. 6(2017)]